MDLWSNGQQRLDRLMVHHRAPRVLLVGYFELFNRMLVEERLAVLMHPAGPGEGGLEDAQLQLDAIGSHRLAGDVADAARVYVARDAFRCELPDLVLLVKEAGQVLAGLGHVIQIGVSFQRAIRQVLPIGHIPPEERAQRELRARGPRPAFRVRHEGAPCLARGGWRARVRPRREYAGGRA